MLRYILMVSLALAVGCGGAGPVAEAPADHGAGTVVAKDPALDDIVPAGYKIEKLDEGFVFIEGPVWIKEGGPYLLFSDVRGNTIYKWAPGGKSAPFLKPVFEGDTEETGSSGGSNGLTLASDGSLIICEHGNRRISKIAAGGTRTTLVDKYDGKRLNSPNDLVFRSDGSLYFTDPPYGLQGQDKSEVKELDFNGVYRLGTDGRLTLLTKELTRPNGIAFSPDEKTLYVANSDRQKMIWMAYDVRDDGTIANGRVLFDATGMEGQGAADGMKVDTAGNLYCTGPGGVLVLTPEGKHLGTIQPAEQPANVAWGDEDAKTLYMTARTGLYRIRLKIPGLLPPGNR